MQWLFLNLIRLFDRKVKRDQRSPSSFDTFRKRAMQHICITGFVITFANGILAFKGGRFQEILSLELPIVLVSLMGFFAIRRVHRVDWIAGLFMVVLATCMSNFVLQSAKSALTLIYAWFPLLSFGAILLCGRRVGMIAVAIIFFESLVVLGFNVKYGFVLPSGISFDGFSVSWLATMISLHVAAFAIVASVEISRQRADRANTTTNAINLRQASLSLLGDMALDMSRNMGEPLAALNSKLEEVLRWDAKDTLHSRGPLLQQSLNHSLRELGRLTESLLLFSNTHAQREVISLRATDFLRHLNELTREKAISRGVSLDFSADQPQAMLQVPAAVALFALVSLVSKGVEAASGQQPAWVRVQLRVVGKQLQLRILDSGPSLSYRERRIILEQTSRFNAWDMNLRLSLDFLSSIGGRLSLDRYSPDTCYVIHIPLSDSPSVTLQAA